MRDNIAVLMTALDSNEQAEILRGIEEYGKAGDCNISVFLWFTGANETENYNKGEINIINLPDLDYFDGVIVFANALHMENNRRQIEKLLKPLSCPIVCIGCKLDIANAVYVGTDNYAGMKQLIEHYVVDHKMNRIHFVKGIEGNEDAEIRFQAYQDVLSEHNIPLMPERITQGDFYVTGGERAAKEIMDSDLEFPQVVICANDTMAVALCDRLIENGYSVPGDVAVAGYDCSIEGQYHSPRITTVRTRFKELGIKACKALLLKMADKEVDKEILLPDELVYCESCGCHSENENNVLTEVPMYVADLEYRKLVHQMTVLYKNINASTRYEDWLNSLKDFISKINPPEFYCCVNDNFVNDVFKIGTMAQEEMSTEEMLEYSYDTEVIVAYKNGQFRNKQRFPSRYALDDLYKDSSRPKLYIFSPLHYLERNFGYFVFVDTDIWYGNIVYVSWLINMGNFIENIRKQSLLKSAMNRLDEMYIKDSLTGVYNRFGMERFFAEIKRKCIMSGIRMQVSFADVDGLKMINDQYGHEEGDRIINATAGALQKYAGKNYVVRYGGDEFVIIGTANDIKEVENYWKYVEREVKLYNDKMKRQAELRISYGYDVFKVDAQTYLEECINIIDKKMYEDKNRKRANQ